LNRNSLPSAVRRALPGPGSLGSGQTLVAGLSGGADSVALLDVLITIGRERDFAVVAAHLDHRLRPSSRDDASFCERICREAGVPLRTGSADVRGRAERDGGGIEEAARVERYAFLSSVKDAAGASFVAVAHTRDDQAETFLLRLLRGAGSTGLAGMRARSGDVLRPLLGVSRKDVLVHLAERGLEWREDPSNADPAFARNRVRRELLPYLEARFNPAVREALARTASLLADEDAAVGGLGRALRERAGRREGAWVVLERTALSEAPRAVARAALREALEETGGLRGVGLGHVDRVLDLAGAAAPSGRRLPLPGGREAAFRFGEVAVGPRRGPARPFALPLDVPGRVSLPEGGSLEARPVEAGTGCDGMRGGEGGAFELVSAPLGAALTVRTRRSGDRVRTRGRQVSLRRFLMDRRVPAELRERLPLVAAGSDVLWIAGVPARDRESDPSGRGGRDAGEAARLVGLRLVAGDGGPRGAGSPT